MGPNRLMAFLFTLGTISFVWVTGCGSPCDGVTCSDHGECEVVDGSAVCVCDEEYHAEGLECVEGAICGEPVDISGIFAIEAVVNVNMVIDIESKQHFLATFEQDGTWIKTATNSCTIELPSYAGIAEITVPDAINDIIKEKAVETEGDFLTDARTCATYDPPPYVILLGADLSGGDPMTDPLPTKDDLSLALDEDADSNPGITLKVKTGLCGEEPVDLYVAVRTVVDLEGRIQHANVIRGDPHPTLEWSILGYSDECLSMTEALDMVVLPDNSFVARRVDGKYNSVDLDTDDDGEVSCEEYMPNLDKVFGES